jgi:hypothetical protein
MLRTDEFFKQISMKVMPFEVGLAVILLVLLYILCLG